MSRAIENDISISIVAKLAVRLLEPPVSSRSREERE
jgi:hypothetical protein